MSLSVYYDGDYTEPQMAEPPSYEIPFKTDPNVYIYKIKYWQFGINYLDSIPNIGDPGPYGGYYVGVSGLKPLSGAVFEFVREFAMVPNTRSEYESFVYSFQFFVYCGLALSGVSELPLTRNSRIQFDYFLTADPDSIDLPKAPKAVQLQGGSCGATVWKINGWSNETPSGTEVLAQDATLKIWKPGIYERQMRFIRWMNITDLLPG